MPIKMGDESAKIVATGAAGGDASTNANTQLEKCSEPLGTLSLVENQQSEWFSVLTGQYKLPPTSNLLRLLVQQSNCFVVVDRSRAGMQAMSRERQLMDSGETRAGSNFGKGQMVASDFGLTPDIQFSAGNTGGMAGSLGGLVGGWGGALLGAAGSIHTREANVLLTLVDNRSGVQIAAAEGSAKKTDFGAAFGALFSGAGAGLGGYSNTPQGKVIAAAFMDAYNQTVKVLRNYKPQQVKGGLGKGGKLKVGN
ncbi:peptidoglycan-binding protein [Limnohabitans sp. T6-5]|nr:peptidoglycan-binding protein [Limnohabitans sp. T6-5]